MYSFHPSSIDNMIRTTFSHSASAYNYIRRHTFQWESVWPARCWESRVEAWGRPCGALRCSRSSSVCGPCGSWSSRSCPRLQAPAEHTHDMSVWWGNIMYALTAKTKCIGQIRNTWYMYYCRNKVKQQRINSNKNKMIIFHKLTSSPSISVKCHN